MSNVYNIFFAKVMFTKWKGKVVNNFKESITILLKV